MFTRHSSLLLNLLSCTIMSRFVCATSGRPIWYTSVSGLSIKIVVSEAFNRNIGTIRQETFIFLDYFFSI